ncbi:MAG: general secretion pathway protein GspK, partial [Candidatus Hydrogenedentota bacterium]
MNPLAANSRRGDEGVALILALLFVVLMAAVVVDLAYEMQVEAMFVDQQDAQFEAYIAAKSAIAGGMGLLAADYYGTGDLFTNTANDPRTQDQNKKPNPQQNQNQNTDQNQGQNEEQNQGQNQGQLYDSLDDAWAQGVAVTPVNDATMQCAIQDEFGKINLNRLLILTGNGQLEVYTPIEDRLRALLEYRELDEETVDTIVDSLIDWMDSGDDGAHEPNGSETDYYQSLDPPYAAKDGPMDSIEELLLIPGITPEVYYGNPDKEQLPLPDLLTVHGHPEGKINVNTAPIPVLEAHFAARREFDP